MTDPSAVTSLWVSVTGWFTPTSLFLFLNLVIGTIAVSSRFTSNKKQQHQHQHYDQYQLGPRDSPGQLTRAPSLLDRVKSINFSLYKFPGQEQEPHFYQQPTEPTYYTNPVEPDRPQLARAPSLLDRFKSINFSLYKFPGQEHELHHEQELEPHYYHQPTEPTYYTNPIEPDRPQLARAPSLLDRLKSINFSTYKFPGYEEGQQPEQEVQEPNFFHQPTEPAYRSNLVEPDRPQLARDPSLVERVKSINFSYVYRSQQQTYPVTKTGATDKTETEANPGYKQKRSKSETKRSKARVQESMKKSVSKKAMAVKKESEEEDEIEALERRRPQTTRLERTVTVGDGDHSVDAKADDFINKFKNQLRLQRLDSLLRYKEMLQGK